MPSRVSSGGTPTISDSNDGSRKKAKMETTPTENVQPIQSINDTVVSETPMPGAHPIGNTNVPLFPTCVSYEDIFIGVNGADKENDPTDHMDWIFDSDFDEEDSIEEEPVGMDPIEYYDKKILWTIGDTLGRTLKVDANTSRRANEELGDVFVTERTKFARLCIDVDLNKILRSQVYSWFALCVVNMGITLDEERPKTKEKVAKESSRKEPFLLGPSTMDKAPNEPFRPWMVVQRPTRR
ncbi:hypothetical protein JHK87_020202 [Glycine soja]|nr:hypothetical protein JHK87_020202 [Glycine soja]